MPQQNRKLSIRERLAIYNRQKKPEKPTAAQGAARRLDVLGTPQQAYPPGSVQAVADSVTAGLKPRAAQPKAVKTEQERVDKLWDKVALYADKADKVDISEKSRKIYLKQSKNFQRRLDRLLYQEKDPEKLREMLARWESDESMPESVRQTMIAKIRARLGESPEPDQGGKGLQRDGQNLVEGTQQNPYEIKDQAEVDKLPSGTFFKWLDGQIYRKD